MINIPNNKSKLFKYVYIFSLVVIISLLLFDFFNAVNINGKSQNLLLIKAIIEIFLLLTLILMLEYRNSSISKTKDSEFEFLTRLIPGGIAKIYGNDNFTIKYADEKFYKITGYSKEELQSQFDNNSMFLVHPDDLHSLIRTLKFQLDNNERLKAEFRIIDKLGNIVWIYAKGNIASKKKDLCLYNFIFSDISKSKLDSSNLMLENQRYEILSNLSQNILFEYDIANKSMTNKGACSDILNKNSIIENFQSTILNRKIIHQDDVKNFLEFCDDLDAGKEIKAITLRFKAKNNDFVCLNIKGKPIFNESNMPIKIIGIAEKK